MFPSLRRRKWTCDRPSRCTNCSGPPASPRDCFEKEALTIPTSDDLAYTEVNELVIDIFASPFIRLVAVSPGILAATAPHNLPHINASPSSQAQRSPRREPLPQPHTWFHTGISFRHSHIVSSDTNRATYTRKRSTINGSSAIRRDDITSAHLLPVALKKYQKFAVCDNDRFNSLQTKLKPSQRALQTDHQSLPLTLIHTPEQ